MPFNFQHLNLCELALHSQRSETQHTLDYQKAEIELMNGRLFQNQAESINLDFSHLSPSNAPLFFEKNRFLVDCQDPINPDPNSN